MKNLINTKALKKAKNCLKPLLIGAICVFSTIGFAQAKSGPGISGGGRGVVLSNSQVLLLDYYANDAQASFAPGVTLPVTAALKKTSIEILNLRSIGFDSKIETLLQTWDASSPEVTKRIRWALKGVPMYYTTRPIIREDGSYFLPSSKNGVPLIKVAYYEDKLGVLYNKDAFERMPLSSQIGVVVHELLRQGQIAYQMAMSDESLQKITSQFVTGNARLGSLDQHLEGALAQPSMMDQKKSAVRKIMNKYPTLTNNFKVAFEASQNSTELADLTSAMAEVLLNHPGATLSDVQVLSLYSSAFLTMSVGHTVQSVEKDMRSLQDLTANAQIAWPIRDMIHQVNQSGDSKAEARVKEVVSTLQQLGILN